MDVPIGCKLRSVCQYTTCAARAAACWGASWGGVWSALLELGLLRLVLCGHLGGRRLLLRLALIGRLLARGQQVRVERLAVTARLGLLLHSCLHRGVLLTS